MTDSLVPIFGGYHVKVRDDGHYCIDVLQMLYSWRVVITEALPVPHESQWQGVEHGWCYFGFGEDDAGRIRTRDSALLAAMLAAKAWDGYGAPVGYDKEAF